MAYDLTVKYWRAEGIPTVPYDDRGNPNYYPMVSIAGRNVTGKILSTTKMVLPISDEMTCVGCHASGGDEMAMPSNGWVNDPNPDKDWKRNILKLHDEKNMDNPLYPMALEANGFTPSGLLATSDSGRPMLCADCHASNALGKAGIEGVKQLTTSIHSWHGQNAMDDSTGMPLDYTPDRSACYYCHPGSTTQCLRGVMGKAKDASGNSLLECQSCHGIMSKVGTGGRRGWIDLPSCQYCHYRSDEIGGYVRDTTVFDSSGNYRQVTSIFSTGPGLYKMSSEHGGVQCEACHGSTHAEYPTSEPNDNLQSVLLQGYHGTIRECSVCHIKKEIPITKDGGPHGLHTIGQAWVYNHTNDAKNYLQYCTICHGMDYKGTFLSKVPTERIFHITGSAKKIYSQGQTVSCYDCHATL